jgi:hypothetical protein
METPGQGGTRPPRRAPPAGRRQPGLLIADRLIASTAPAPSSERCAAGRTRKMCWLGGGRFASLPQHPLRIECHHTHTHTHTHTHVRTATSCKPERSCKHNTLLSGSSTCGRPRGWPHNQATAAVAWLPRVTGGRRRRRRHHQHPHRHHRHHHHRRRARRFHLGIGPY